MAEIKTRTVAEQTIRTRERMLSASGRIRNVMAEMDHRRVQMTGKSDSDDAQSPQEYAAEQGRITAVRSFAAAKSAMQKNAGSRTERKISQVPTTETAGITDHQIGSKNVSRSSAAKHRNMLRYRISKSRGHSKTAGSTIRHRNIRSSAGRIVRQVKKIPPSVCSSA